MTEFRKPVETVSPFDAFSSAPAGAGNDRADSGTRRGEPGSGSLRRTQWSNPSPHGEPDGEPDRPVRKGAGPLVLTVAGLAALVVVAGVIGSMVWVISSSHSAGPAAAPAAATDRASLVGVPLGTGQLAAIPPQPGATTTAGSGASPSSSASLTQQPSASVPASAAASTGPAVLAVGNASGTASPAAKAAASATSSAKMSVATYQALPGTWPQCAAENANCSFSGTKVVAFGAKGGFHYALGTGTIGCNVQTFGDPLYFTVKACYAQAAAPAGGVWSACAGEGGTCAFSGIMTVAFGADGNYVYATLDGGTACSDSVFGDPAHFKVKTCYLMGSPPSFTAWNTCAGENGTCSFSGTHEVAFGSAGRYYYGSFTGSAPCDSAVFGDPIIGVQKTCYVQ